MFDKMGFLSMNTFYTNERNVQIVISLLKAHGIKYVVASPGTTNISLVASLQQDSFFKIFSAADERSAAYIACGIAAESEEPVVLSCTGATASRNYMPGLTEAYYRKLPILAITSSQHVGRIGNMFPQVLDRFSLPNDIAKLSVHLPMVFQEEDEWACVVDTNKALLELRHGAPGPVHINLATSYSRDFSVKELPPVRVIRRFNTEDKLPEIPTGKIGIFVGAHVVWTPAQMRAVDEFCEKYNGVVFCDHTSNYRGKYRILSALIGSQECADYTALKPDLLIHIGEISGDYAGIRPRTGASVWRVSPDGKICDLMRALQYVFEMNELTFFERYNQMATELEGANCYWNQWQDVLLQVRAQIPDLPFSNVWMASQLAPKLPEGSVLHLGILNSLRSWNFFETPASVAGFCNTGGFGIDGCMSSMLGASFAAPEKLFFGVFGDLAFFYDMNSLGNRHVGKNLRILLVNNGRGTEFRNYQHPASRFGDDADAYMAAAGHYGNKSAELIKHYAQDLGFEYLFASTKEEFIQSAARFAAPEITDRPILFEVFTDSKDESDALRAVHNIEKSVRGSVKHMIKSVLGPNTISKVKAVLGK